MLNLNYYFCFSYFRESNPIKSNKNRNPKILHFTHFLSPGLKLYINLKYSSSFFCEFYFTMMYKIIETGFTPTISFLYIYLFNKSTALNHGKCINTGEPTAVFGLPLRIKVVELLLPETSAAGSLFHPSPITPLPHHPIFRKPLNTRKTRTKKSRVNHISRRTKHERS
jgi:hypothetical protein